MKKPLSLRVGINKMSEIHFCFVRTVVISFVAFLSVCPVEARSFSLDLGKRSSRARGATLLSTGESSSEGALRSYSLQPGSADVGVVAVDDELAVSVFDDVAIQLRLAEKTPALPGHEAFIAEPVDGDGMNTAVVIRSADGLSIDVHDGEKDRIYRVVSSSSGVTVREIKPGVINCGADQLSAKPSECSCSECTAKSLAARKSTLTAAGSSQTYVDIMVAYDTMAADYVRNSGGTLENFAETSVQKMNVAIANTGLASSFRFRLVGVFAAGGNAGGGISQVLTSIVNPGTTLNGYNWSVLEDEREKVYADIVCVLADNGTAYGTTGIGFSLDQSNASGFAASAYNACLVRAVENSHTMTHEVGHNMGCGHATAVDSSQISPGPQYHNYSAGHHFTGTDGVKYHTIMAYNFDGFGNYYTGIPYFSSPNYNYKGRPVGDSTHNNTLTLLQNFEMVSNFRNAPMQLSEIGVGLDAESFTWVTSGTYPWQRVTDNSYDSVDSVRSCEMSGSTTSWMKTTVTGPGNLSFKFRIRTYGGTFKVLCDETALLERSSVIGYGSWESSSSLSIPTGTHDIKFQYTHPSQGFASGGNGVWIDNLVCTCQPYGGSSSKPQIEGDSGAVVSGSASSGYTITPSDGLTVVKVTIPSGVDAGKVTVKVGPGVTKVKPNGAKVKVISSGTDITSYLDIPSADSSGYIDMSSATVKDSIVKETVDESRGAKIVLGPSSPSIKTAPTRQGLKYTFSEGRSIDGMTQKSSKTGDGTSWTPSISIKGGSSGFYSIGVGK